MQTIAACRADQLSAVLAQCGLSLVLVGQDQPIPGSFWGAPEAGIIGNRVYVRADTPVHSMAHEACHLICARSRTHPPIHTDAGGSDLEECAVCVLQILLADLLPGCSRQRMMRDMDAWGYSFRLGSTQAWFEHDAADAHQWLVDRGLVIADCHRTSSLDESGQTERSGEAFMSAVHPELPQTPARWNPGTGPRDCLLSPQHQVARIHSPEPQRGAIQTTSG